MAFQDPRVLIPRVQGLTDKVQDWEHRSGAAFETGEYTQRLFGEQVRRADAQVSAALSQARDDQYAVETLVREVERSRDRCAAAARHVQQTRLAAVQTRGRANQAVTHWHHELDLARQWLARARTEERRAELERDQARAALSQAQQALAAAERELAAARSRREYAGRDSEGRDVYRPVNTAPYEAAVSRARQEVSRCQAWLQAAEAALHRAVLDRQAAERRVASCTAALGFAQQAQSVAARSVESADRAGHAVERLHEEQNRASGSARQAEEHYRHEQQAVHDGQTQAAAARDRHTEAQTSLTAAHADQEDARLHATQGRHEIDWRMDQLRAFDAPMPSA